MSNEEFQRVVLERLGSLEAGQKALEAGQSALRKNVRFLDNKIEAQAELATTRHKKLIDIFNGK